MSEYPPREEEGAEEEDLVLTVRRLQGLQHGIAALLMRLENGWRVHYFSRPSFETEPGEDYATFDAAISAIAEVLEAVNTPEQREQVRIELREYLRRISEERSGDHSVK